MIAQIYVKYIDSDESTKEFVGLAAGDNTNIIVRNMNKYFGKDKILSFGVGILDDSNLNIIEEVEEDEYFLETQPKDKHLLN